MEFTKNLQEPWFTLVSLGIQRVECRVRKGCFHDVREGEVIVWSNTEFGYLRVHKSVVSSARVYRSFEKCLRMEGIENCLPSTGIASIETGAEICRKNFSMTILTSLTICA